MSATSSPTRRAAEEEARKTQPHQEAEDTADNADLRKDERALFDLMYERLKPKFLAQVLELFPDDDSGIQPVYSSTTAWKDDSPNQSKLP